MSLTSAHLPGTFADNVWGNRCYPQHIIFPDEANFSSRLVNAFTCYYTILAQHGRSVSCTSQKGEEQNRQTDV